MSYRNLKKILVYLFSILSVGAIAMDPVIYGEDNRIETFESQNPMIQRLAGATAGLIPNHLLELKGNNAFVVAPSVAETYNICRDERFALQPKATVCSGVLVAPDIIATAGHCYMGISTCEDKSWVFNYKLRNPRTKQVVIRARDVYRCKEVIEMKLTEVSKNPPEYLDFALIRLDRPVKNAVPVTVASVMPKVGTRVFTIGNPSGLPQKVTDGGRVKSTGKSEFKANLDTFDQGSGSPVFSEETGEYLGILVRGETDFVQHKTRSCRVANRISDDEPGEDIQSTTRFVKILKSR